MVSPGGEWKRDGVYIQCPWKANFTPKPQNHLTMATGGRPRYFLVLATVSPETTSFKPLCASL